MFISEILKDLICKMPMEVVAAYAYHDRFVSMDLKDVNEQAVSMRLYLCDWVLREHKEILASSSVEIEQCKPAIATLVGSQLIDFVQHDVERLELSFGCGKSLILSADLENYDDDDDLIMIYVPNHYGAAYSPEAGFRKEFVERVLQ